MIDKYEKKIFENLFLDKYSSYIKEFDKHNINLSYTIDKVKRYNRYVFLAEVKTTPKKQFKENEKYWKTFATKLYISKDPKISIEEKVVVRKDFLFGCILKKHLKRASKCNAAKVCRENLSNHIYRMLCFTNFRRFPTIYRGKDVVFVYFIIGIFFYAIVFGIARYIYLTHHY